jgi:vacuolar-type H+-ATPase subunit H
MTPREQTEHLKQKASDLADQTRRDLAASARERGEDIRDSAVENADQLSGAAEDASRNFEPGSLQADALRAVTQQIDAITRHLRDRPLDELFDDAAVFARKNPLLVLGGAAVVGFAAARFLKADAGIEDESPPDDPWITDSAHPDRRAS